jgi:hypothetical protein
MEKTKHGKLKAFPFEMPERLRDRIPPPGRDGYSYVEAVFSDGHSRVLAIDANGKCAGIHCKLGISQEDPFCPDDIERLEPVSVAWREFKWFIAGPLLDFFSALAVLAIPVLLIFRVRFGIWTPIFMILLAALGQLGVLVDIRRYCLTGIPMLVGLAVVQIVAIVMLFL